MASIKLVSVNIERDRHLDRIIPFLQREAPDVVCLQEVREPDLPRFEAVLRGDSIFSPMMRHHSDNFSAVIGEAILSRFPMREKLSHYYVGTKDAVPNEELPHKQSNHACTIVDIAFPEGNFRIVTTHFTWTPDGKPNDRQRADLRSLMGSTAALGEFVLVGDFNAPRGGEIFGKLSSHFTDNIPAKYTTSLDVNLHHAGRERLKADAEAMGVPGQMVDGLFTTPVYVASDVRLESGVSDHLAIVATLTKITGT